MPKEHHDTTKDFCDIGPDKERLVRPVRRSYKHTKCGRVITIGPALAETFARNPGFYKGTFHCECGGHFPVNEFVWAEDGKVVGS